MARRKIVAPFGRCRSAQTGEQDPEDVCRDFAAGNLRHFSRLPEAYTLRARAGEWVREAVGSRDIDVRRVERRHCQPPPPADDESIDAPHADSAWPTTSSPDRPLATHRWALCSIAARSTTAPALGSAPFRRLVSRGDAVAGVAGVVRRGVRLPQGGPGVYRGGFSRAGVLVRRRQGMRWCGRTNAPFWRSAKCHA